MLHQLILQVEPYLIEAIVSVIGMGLMWLARKLPETMGAVIEQKWRESEALFRDSLHMAARSGLQSAFEMGLTGQAALEYAIQHMRRSVAEAIINLKADDTIMTDIVMGKATEMGKSLVLHRG